MDISRRDLLKWAAVSATAMGLGADTLLRLQSVLAAPGSPPVIWLQGASCSGCSISLLNATASPIETVLTETVSMKYHHNLTAAYGEAAISSMFDAADLEAGKFVLCVEGAVPTALGGRYCVLGTRGGTPLTMLDAVRRLGPKAKRVVAVGTCASFGGVARPSRYTGVQTVTQVLAGTGLAAPVANLPGCPAHPDTVIAALVKILTDAPVGLDSRGRPSALFGDSVHHSCPRRESGDASSIGRAGCYEEIGCRGPDTAMACPQHKWNGGRNWCIAANQACIGCAAPDFPTNPLLSGGGD
jgi:hydrogenase small subunit